MWPYDPTIARQLRIIAAPEDSSVQQLVEEGIAVLTGPTTYTTERDAVVRSGGSSARHSGALIGSATVASRRVASRRTSNGIVGGQVAQASYEAADGTAGE